jgi:hypothetical protein
VASPSVSKETGLDGKSPSRHAYRQVVLYRFLQKVGRSPKTWIAGVSVNTSPGGTQLMDAAGKAGNLPSLVIMQFATRSQIVARDSKAPWEHTLPFQADGEFLINGGLSLHK